MTRADALAAIADARARLEAVEAFLVAQDPPSPQSPPSASAGSARGLSNPKAFFDALRSTRPFGPELTQPEVAGCNRILKACDGLPVSWTAYVTVTDFHETAGRMFPVREIGRGKGRPYGLPGRNNGQIPYGRGDVQLTWDHNYERADRELGLNGRLIADYDLALDPEVSARILVQGMVGGWFDKKGRGLAAWLPETATQEQFVNARRTVNLLDKADLLAGYALNVQSALQKGGWR